MCWESARITRVLWLVLSHWFNHLKFQRGVGTTHTHLVIGSIQTLGDCLTESLSLLLAVAKRPPLVPCQQERDGVQFSSVQFSSVQSLSRVRLFATAWIAACQASLSFTTPGVYPDPCPSSQWCHPGISYCCPLLLLHPIPPSIRLFPMSQLFAWGDQSIGVSASTSVLPKNTQNWSPLGWTGWIFFFLYT